MLLAVFVFASLLGFIVGFGLCLWWHLEEEKDISSAGISTLPRNYEDIIPETSDWFQLLAQFFFQRTRNKAFIKEYAYSQLRKEVSSVLSKINGIKKFEVRELSLGESPPLLDCFQVLKIKKSAEADDEIEELALQTNFSYLNGISFVLSVSHVLGVADLSVAVSQLSGVAILGFVTCPCEYWYFSFKEEPTIDLKVKVRGQLLPFKSKIERLVSNGICKGIRKMHMLPAIKPRFKPFFSSDITKEQLSRTKDEHFRPRYVVDFFKENSAKKEGTNTDLEKTSLEVTIARLSNLSLSFNTVQIEKVFVTASVDYEPLVPCTVFKSSKSSVDQSSSSLDRKVVTEFLNFSIDKTLFKQLFSFVQSKQIENGTICYRLKVSSILPGQTQSCGTSADQTPASIDVHDETLKQDDVILSINGVDIVSKHFNEVDQLMETQVDAEVNDFLCSSAKDVLKIFVKREHLGIARTSSEPLNSGNDNAKSSRRVDSGNSESAPVIFVDDLEFDSPLPVGVGKERTQVTNAVDESVQNGDQTNNFVADDDKAVIPNQKVGEVVPAGEQQIDEIVPIRVARIRHHSVDSAISFIVDENEAAEERGKVKLALSASSIDVSKIGCSENQINPSIDDQMSDRVVRRHSKGNKECNKIKEALVLDSLDHFVTHSNSNPTQCEVRQRRSFSAAEASNVQIHRERRSLDGPECAASSIVLDGTVDSEQHSGLFSSSHIINCCNSLIRNTFSFEVQPWKSEFLNLTIWGVDSGSGCHYALANLSVSVGHILNLCSITSNLSASKTFYLSKSVLAFASPANSACLQLHNTSDESKAKLLARCYGSISCQFKVHRSVASSQTGVVRKVKPRHRNEKPPLSVFASIMNPLNLSQANNSQRQGRRYFPHLRGPKSSAPSQSNAGHSTKTVATNLADKLKPRIQHESKFVSTAMKSSLNALHIHSNAQPTEAQSTISSDLSGTSHSIGSCRSSAGLQIGHGGGTKLAGKIVQMKGNVKKMSTEFLKEQSFMDRAKQSQQKITSKAKPFRQLFNRNKGSTAPQRIPNQPDDAKLENFAMVNPEDLLSSLESSVSVNVPEHTTTSNLQSSTLHFLEYDELDFPISNDEELTSVQETEELSVMGFHSTDDTNVIASGEEFTHRLSNVSVEDSMELSDEIDHRKFGSDINDETDGCFSGDIHHGGSDEFNDIDDIHNLAIHSDGFVGPTPASTLSSSLEDKEVEIVFGNRFPNDE